MPGPRKKRRGSTPKKPTATPPLTTGREGFPHRFSSRVQAGAWAHEHFTAWQQALNEGEVAAIHAYKGGAHVAVNSHLRGVSEDPLDTARAAEIIPHLDTCLGKQRLQQAVVVFRHLDLEHLPARPDLLIGQVIPDPGYCSTSLVTDFPRQLQELRGGVILEIHVPAGTPVAYLDLVRDRREHELLLPRGTRVRITAMGENRRLLGEVVS